MNIAIIGNSFFGQILERHLNDFDEKNFYTFYNTNEKYVDKLKFVRDILFMDIVYSVSATISGGGALNLALKLNKKIVQHFIGSDVLSAQEDFKKQNINQKLIKKSKYLCEVDWIQRELKDIEINATISSIIVYENSMEAKAFENFTVLTYVGKGKEKFYGIEDFIALARDFPNITFNIAGIERYKNLPENIKCLGWVNMFDTFQNSTVFIRNVSHDGLAFTVLEALSLGRVVFYNYHFPHVSYFNEYLSLKNQFEEVVAKFYNHTLNVNEKSIEFVKENFNKEKVLPDLIKAICE